MPKYRLLTKEELAELEKEFVEFLVLNGITAEDWIKVKTTDSVKAERFVELFSDVVMEGVLRKIKFLELRGEKFLHIYQCLPNQLVLVAMECEDEEVNFLNPDFIQSAMLTPPASVAVYTNSRAYKETREQELFALIREGAFVTNDVLFRTLCMMLPA